MRLFIYPSDIQILTGKSLRYAQNTYNTIISAFGKERKKGLLIKDYAQYHGVPEEDIIKALTNK